MGKLVDDSVLDASHDEVKNNATRMTLCVGQPTTYGQATTAVSGGGKMVAEVAIDDTDFTGPADGDTSGRKLDANEQTGVDVDESGNVDHVAIVDDANSVLLLVTTCPTQAVTAGNTATIQAFKREILDPS